MTGRIQRPWRLCRKKEADHDHQFQVFGVDDGDDDRFVLAVQEFGDAEKADRVARRMLFGGACGSAP
jgi:hypothetical protein